MKYSISVFILCILICVSGKAFASGEEFTGHFDRDLVANTEDFEQIILKFVTRDKVKGSFEVAEDSHLAASKLIDPRTQDRDILALLAEEDGESPVIYVDLDGDKALTPDEKFTLLQSEDNDPYLWEATVHLKMKGDMFTGIPIFIQYYRSYKNEDMGPDDRLITQSTEVFAKGSVDIGGNKVLFQYEFDADKAKVDPKNGMLGVDMNSDGKVDMGDMSAESTKANNESVVFRFGDSYFATKKADVKKDLIVVEQRQAKDYKRVEIYLNKEFPDFTFTDFEGKKRKFSEFRGKFVILDIWGFWCPPCRHELPYLREANRRFRDRNLVIVGLNTDESYTIGSMRKGLAEAGMTWTNAEFSSVAEFLSEKLRVSSFPTTFLISPEGNVLSIGRTARDEPSLRGSGLLESLDKILPAP
jgi:thiol-disulfide isomerase/thioredoxin